MLNEAKCFMFKKLGKYEVCASIENIFAFFTHFFPKVKFMDGADDLAKLNTIFGAISFGHQLTCTLRESYDKEKFDDQHYKNQEIDIFVNGEHVFVWQIYQYFQVNRDEAGSQVSLSRRTGHSDYRFVHGTKTRDD